MPMTLLPRIEEARINRLLRIGRNEREQLEIENAPPTKSSGFYWIYTDYSQEELEGQLGSPCRNAVDIGLLARLHKDLRNICNIKAEGFRLVYNGISGNSCGVRERLHQHFNGGEGTGSLAILRTGLSDLERWRVSYATIEVPFPKAPDVQAVYADVARHAERMWRLQNGWPILCTK
jgi:hypothetical protein